MDNILEYRIAQLEKDLAEQKKHFEEKIEALEARFDKRTGRVENFILGVLTTVGLAVLTTVMASVGLPRK